MSISKLFTRYLREKLGTIILLIVFILIFVLVFWLSNLDFYLPLYAGEICLFIGLIVFIINFFRFCKLNKELVLQQKKIITDIESLPETTSLMEENYQELLRLLYSEHRRYESAAAKATEELTDYYTMWAHQIKVPIAAMRLLLQTEESELNTQLLSELFRVEQYVQMVLSYLRIEENTDFKFQSYSLDRIVRPIVHKYAHLFIRKKITLEYKPLQSQILTDDKWLAFVVEQLLSNALKYTPTGGKIQIYEPKDKRLVIEDSGIGISPEDLPRIGEKGFTGYNGHEHKQATGLGLYLSKKIMKKLSHNMSFESEIGRGTKVTLIFKTYSSEYYDS